VDLVTGKYGFLSDPAFQKLSPELQKQVFAREAGSSDIQALGGLLERFSDPKKMREQLQIASEFDKERMKEAGKYKLLFDLPDRIIQAATLPGQLAAEGARGIASSMMEAGANIPQLVSYQRGSYSYTPTRYFQ